MSDKRKELIQKAAEFTKDIANKFFPKKEKFTEAVLEDGETQITFDAEVIATGVQVFLINAEGQTAPLPEGSYMLQDGTTFDIVDAEGTADNVVLAAPPEEAPPATGADMKKKEETPKVKSIIETTTKESHFKKQEMKELEELKAEFKSLKEEFEAMKTEKVEMATAKEASDKVEKEAKEKLEKEDKEFKDKAKEVFELIGKIAEEPAKKPEEKKQTIKFDVAEQKKNFKEDLDK